MSAGDIGALLSRIGSGIFQQAWVVDDLDAAEAAMRTSLGCGEFTKFVMDEPWTLRGKPASCALSLGFARSGNMQIELMQPLSGEGVQVEFLKEHGPGPHHLGVLVDDLDAALAAAADDGFESPMAGQFATVRLAFLDTVDVLGMYIELIEDPRGLLWATMPWRDERPHRGAR
jgi:catechol 2,3-dioxygenase-like lactoylglutathione lyase family enzyme